MKLLEMEKDMRIKHSVSSPSCKLWENFFRKTFSGQIYGRMFYTWTNDQIMQWWMLIVKRFQRLSQVSFPLIGPDLGY